ncbi:MAG TPA: protein kinase [Tepidisphaeraceae bacterium]|nr:protein kinase [Tepidisphaeraceae bacterium]
MPLTPDTRLGPYEIVAPLGAGGMGEVYRARDTRLGREVALKVLPAALSSDPGRRARFEQEARATAALSHPNIVAVYDIGQVPDMPEQMYLVSELVPGETLAAFLERGPVPTKKLLDLAVQIADGMAAAHAARITHRDLKPANILVTPEGRAKILDFGLAKQATVAGAAPDETLTVQQTEPGMILGTVAYMSPEQARGKPADHRSDQFSFGLMLYEMAAGRRAFDKPESVQTMSAILSEDPPPIERNIPAPLRWAIDRCLSKDPEDRYESTRDLFQDLRHIRDHVAESTSVLQAAATPVKVRRTIRWVFPLVGTLGLIGAVLLGRYFAPARYPDQSTYRYTPFAFDPGGQSAPVWSPDGKAVAYAGHPGGAFAVRQVMVRYLDSSMPQQVTRLTDDAVPIAWAPDGMRILFTSQHAPSGIWSISVAGGEPESFFPFSGRQLVAVSPDLRTVAVVRRGEDHLYGIWISSPPNATPRKYTPDPIASHTLYNEVRLGFSPNGKTLLLFMRGDRGADESWLLPYPPDPSHPPKLVLPNLPTYGGTPNFAWLPDSRRVALSMSSSSDAAPQLWLADVVSNRRTALTSGTTSRSSVSVSPDGSKLVFTELTGSYDVISVDLEHATPERLIATERNDSMPAWAANEHALVYATDRSGANEIWLRNHAGDHPVVTPRDFPAGTTQWFMGPALSPDGARVAYTRIESQGGSHLWMSSTAGGAPVRVTNDATSGEFTGSWSPDGSMFVYLAVRSGKMDLLKVRMSGQAAPTLLKSDLNCETPSWSPTGDWIQYGDHLITPDGQTVHDLPDLPTQNYVFSKDGKLLYGLRQEPDRTVLYSITIANNAQKTIGSFGREFRPESSLHPAVRFSLAPDGKSFVYSAGTFSSNLWMLTGALTP